MTPKKFIEEQSQRATLASISEDLKKLTITSSLPLIGLKNPGGKSHNKCYINASLQLLYAIPELHEELSKLTTDTINRLKPAKKINYNTGEITNTNVPYVCRPQEKNQIRALKAILERMRSKEELDTDNVMVNNKKAYQLILDFSPDFEYHRQADASAVVNSFLQLFNPYSNCQGFEDLTRKIFIDKTKNNVKLKSNPSQFVPLRDNEELPILQIQIDNPNKATNIKELLENYERPSNIEESNGRINKFPGDLMIQDKKTIKLHNEQSVVIIQVKRFAYDKVKQTVSKLRTVIIPNERITIDNKDFILEGCILHQGGTISGGHYVYLSFINGVINQVINDEKISKESYYINMLNTDGYLFLYKRINKLSQTVGSVPSNNTSSIKPTIASTKPTNASIKPTNASKHSMTLRSSTNTPKSPKRISTSKPISTPKPASAPKPITSNNDTIAQLIGTGKTIEEAMNIIRANNTAIAKIMGKGKTLEEAKEVLRLRRTKKHGGRTRRHRKTKKQF